ncbi:hypothetical protein AB4Z52_22750 [Rhizobium sp. 2YAF20]|uniref:hypothetical protein n=1 Tax=Rhizobium sp. 2YAF20 TaxID=3233027 RepID=UPI003F946A17
MARRKQFKGICHDILETFISRYNDLDGYWALGQYLGFLVDCNERQIQFNLRSAITLPDNAGFGASAAYYRGAIFRLMDANAMPRNWFADAYVTFSIIGPAKALCEIEVVSDLGKAYRCDRIVNVRPHNPSREQRRGERFGPSNQTGH